MSAARAPAIDGARRFDNAASEAFFSTLELGVTEERIYLDPGLTGPADDTLFVGTDLGVYRSTNLGTTWSVFGTGLAKAQVVSLDFAPALHILGAGTHGRGLWEILVPAPTATGSSNVATS